MRAILYCRHVFEVCTCCAKVLSVQRNFKGKQVHIYIPTPAQKLIRLITGLFGQLRFLPVSKEVPRYVRRG